MCRGAIVFEAVVAERNRKVGDLVGFARLDDEQVVGRKILVLERQMTDLPVSTLNSLMSYNILSSMVLIVMRNGFSRLAPVTAMSSE